MNPLPSRPDFGERYQADHYPFERKGIGVLITDHNVRETLDICEKAFIVGDGHIIAEGTATDILNNQKVKEVYLGDGFRL